VNRRRTKNQIREEAFAWVTRLKDAHSAEDRRAFEAWIADPENRSAYDQAAGAFEASGMLAKSALGRGRDLEAAFSPRRPTIGWGLAAAGAAAVVLVGAYQLTGRFNFGPASLETVMLSTGAGETKQVSLADGSKLTIGPASAVRVELGRARRVAELGKGHIRLAVAKEDRPFVIVAGAHRVEAREGVFEAELTGTEGTIAPARAQPEPVRATLNEASGATPGVTKPSTATQPSFEFAAEPLGIAIQRINRASEGPRIELDPNLAHLRVTGVFQQGDTVAIARALALAFNLQAIETSTGSLHLTRKK
jgi:transmembrane sensor